MDRSSLNYCFAIATDIRVSGIHRHHRVVLSHGRTEEQRAIFSQLQCQPGQESGILVVQSKLTRPECFDIAESIEHSKGVSLFQHPGAHIDAR